MARFSGSTDGGAAAVVTVNGVSPDGAGNVLLPASAIPSTGGDVQTDLDLLAGSSVTGVKSFESWPEFAALATEAPAGTWTFDQPLVGAGTIFVPAGAQIVGGESSGLAALVPASLTFIADVDAPVLSGPLQCRDLVVVNSNAGASAAGFDLSTSAGRIPFLQSVQVIGGRVGVRISASSAPVRVQSTISIDADVGFQVAAAAANVLFDGCSATSVVAGFVGFEVTSAASTTGGILAQTPSLVLSTSQHGFAIAHAATFTTPALMQIAGATNTGPQDAMVRQTAPGVTDMAIDDDRLVIKGGPSVANWAAEIVASRFDIGDPLIVDTSTAGAGVNTVIPYEDGAGNLEIVASIEIHFELFKNGADPLDWYLEYVGPLADATIRLASDILADRASAGPSTAILCWERAPFIGPGHGAFAVVPDSEVPWSNTNGVTPRSGIATFKGTNQFDRFRPVISDSSATDVRLGEIKVDLNIGS